MLFVINTFRDRNLVKNQTNLEETLYRLESRELVGLPFYNPVNLYYTVLPIFQSLTYCVQNTPISEL